MITGEGKWQRTNRIFFRREKRDVGFGPDALPSLLSLNSLERDNIEGDIPVSENKKADCLCSRVWFLEFGVKIWEASTPNPKNFSRPIEY